GHAFAEFHEGRLQEHARRKMDFRVIVGDEDLADFSCTETIDQAGREKGAGADADIHIETVEIQSIDGDFQGPQGTKFVHSADGAAAGNGEADFALVFCGLAGGLQYEHEMAVI
ncbi:MAG: hypothetical protein RIQ43_362, partial [Pseudomonadota bacterium]